MYVLVRQLRLKQVLGCTAVRQRYIEVGLCAHWPLYLCSGGAQQFPDPALFASFLQGAAARRVVPVMPCGNVAAMLALDMCDVGLSGLSRSSKLRIAVCASWRHGLHIH